MFSPALTSEEVLSRVDEFSILKYYLPQFNGPGMYYSTLRGNDTNCSMSVRMTEKGLKISDFGLESYKNMSVFTYLMRQFKLPDNIKGYLSILSKIATDFKLPLETYADVIPVEFIPTQLPTVYSRKFEVKPASEISVVNREWGTKSIDYYLWSELYNIPSQTIFPRLAYYNVYPCLNFSINNSLFYPREYSPSYSFSLGDYYKVYSPLEQRKQFKWINSIPRSMVYGLDKLPDRGELLVVEKSVKDMVILSLLGYKVVALNSESTFLDEKVWEELNQRFKVIYVHLDNDKAGYVNGSKFTEKYGARCIYNPINLPKDSSDVVEKYKDLKTLNLIIKYLINNYRL